MRVTSAPRLIINADDFGEPKFTESIRRAFDDRVITSATALLNRAGAPAKVQQAIRKGQSVGLHFNVTAGKPLAPPKRVASIVDNDGLFLGKEPIREKLARGEVDPDDLALECMTQLDVFLDAAGSPPSHVDGHHHVHVRPQVARAVAPVISRAGVHRIRMPLEAPEFFEHIPNARRTWALDLQRDAQESCDIYAGWGLRWPDFMGFGISLDDCQIDRVIHRLEGLQQGVTEWMVHLAVPGVIPAQDPAAAREREWITLHSEPLWQAIRDRGITLGDFESV